MRTIPYGRAPQFAQFARDPAGLAHLRDEALPLVRVAHGRAAAGGRPHRRHYRPDNQAQRAHFVRQACEVVIARVDGDVRLE
jgi:hypothetical protein